MLKVKIVCIGKIKERFFTEAIEEYSKRLSAFCAFSVCELSESRISVTNEANIKKALEEEGKRILAAKDGMLAVLDRQGKTFSSPQLAKLLSDAAQNVGAITFVIGSSFGLSDEVKNNADILLSFGAITLPHQLFRVVLLEQLYRGFSINNNTPYHK